jgi:hypothetical protein
MAIKNKTMNLNKTHLLIALLLTFCVIACKKTEVKLPIDNELIGRWQSTVQGQPKGTMVYTYIYNADNSYFSSIYIYGVYPGQNLQDSSASTVYRGRYSAQNSKLSTTPVSVVQWDKFFAVPPQTKQLHDGTGVIEYRLNKDTLVFSYLSYPADAPVATTMKYIRVH